MKRLVYLSMAIVLLVGLLPAATAAQQLESPEPRSAASAGTVSLLGISLTPESQQGSTTCWDAEAYYTFELLNETGVDSFFGVTVSAVFPTTCPAQVYAADGQSVSFECAVGVPLGGEADTATITVNGQGYSDSATATTAVDRTGQWAAQPPSPMATQDGAVISWGGKLYVVGGTGANGAVQIWDGASWTVGAANGYNNSHDYDACLGLDGAGNPVIDLMGAGSWIGTMRYDIDADTWTNLPAPAGYPEYGLLDIEIVSMLQHTGGNVCYIAGGTTYSHGVSNDLYAYNPAALTATNLGTFAYAPLDLREHFAWYVPWVEGGAICIAGGRYWDPTTGDNTVYADSQCYVLATGVVNAPNADLGPLPEPWKEGGDAWREHGGQYEIWGHHGTGDSMQTLQASFYAAPGQPFTYGPEPVNEFLAAEGDNYDGSIWAGSGSTAGYWASALVESLNECPTSCVAPSGAGFDWSPPVPAIGEPVTLTAAMPGGTGPRTYGWELGDGSTAAGKTVQHTYTVPGDYLVTLTVTNDCGTADVQHTLTVIGVPNLALTPSSLEATLEPESQAQQTLSVCNAGTEPLTWVLTEAPGTKAVKPAPTLSRGQVLSQGVKPAVAELARPFAKKLPPASGVASPPIHPDAVLWEQVPEYAYYLYSDLWQDLGLALWTADDFENAQMWQLDTIHLYGFQEMGSLGNAVALHWCLYPDAGGAPAGHPFVGGETWCWSTQPTDPAVTLGGGVAGGDVTLDLVAGMGAPLFVPAGHWWLLFYPEFHTLPDDMWAVLLTETTNLALAHFVDPANLLGGGWTSWTPLSGLGLPADMAFRLEGLGEAYDIPWLGEDPTSGTVLPGACTDVTVAFSSAGLDPGTYAGNLQVMSNDPDTPLATVPVNMTVELPGPRISVTPASLAAEQCPGAQTTQTLEVCSTGSEDLTWSLAEAIDWLSATPLGGTLVPGDCDSVTVTFASAGLLPGSFIDALTVDSNDAHTPQVQVPVQMTVLEPVHDPGFSWEPAVPITGEPATFTGTAAGAEPIDYAWDLGDGGGGGGAVVEHTYAAPGDYLVTLTVSNACGQASVQHTVTVVAPDIAVSPDSLSAELCSEATAQQTLQVCNTGGADLTWSLDEAIPWLSADPMGGAVLPGACADVTVAFGPAGLAPGEYAGSLLIDSDDPDTPQVTVPVGLTVPDPVHGADFSWAPASPYVRQLVTFTGTAQGSGPIHYAWAFDTEALGAQGRTEGDNPVAHRYAAPGDYTASMWAWNACGSQLVQHTLTVVPSPPLMHVHWIRPSYADRGGGQYAVLGRVLIVDASRAAVPGAVVLVEWTAPNGSHGAQQRLTNPNGVAPFVVPTAQVGQWQLCVTDVVLAGWVYDPAANLETCDTVTIP